MHPFIFFFSKENFFKNKSISRTGFQNWNLWSCWQFQGKRTVQVISGGMVYLPAPSRAVCQARSGLSGLWPAEAWSLWGWWLPSLLGNLFQCLAAIPVENSPYAELRFPSWQPLTTACFENSPSLSAQEVPTGHCRLGLTVSAAQQAPLPRLLTCWVPHWMSPVYLSNIITLLCHELQGQWYVVAECATLYWW